MMVDKVSFHGNASSLDRLVAKVIGSGKSTLARAMADRVQESMLKVSSAIMVPMDGYHLYRSQLAAMPNVAEAIHRRGAAFTFDADRFYKLVQALAEPITSSTPTISTPSFDHAVIDPVENGIAIPVDARVIIFEGLYLSLDRGPWSLAAEERVATTDMLNADEVLNN